MTLYYMEIETDGVVPEEDWVKVFRIIKKDVVGEEAFIKIEFGTVDDKDAKERYTGDTHLL